MCPQLTWWVLLLLHQLNNLLGYLGTVRRGLLDKVLGLGLVGDLELLVLVVKDKRVSQAVTLLHDALGQLIGLLWT